MGVLRIHINMANVSSKIFMNKEINNVYFFFSPKLTLVQEVLVKLITPIEMLPVF